MMTMTLRKLTEHISKSLLFRLSRHAAVLMLGTATCAMADVVVECPAEGFSPQLTLSFAGDVLTIKDPQGSTTLPAALEPGQANAFTITGHGPMDAMMPEIKALDECLAAKLKEENTTAADENALAYAENACRMTLMPTATTQKTDANYAIFSADPKTALVSIQNTYTAPSAVTGKPLQLDALLPRNCNILSGP